MKAVALTSFMIRPMTQFFASRTINWRHEWGHRRIYNTTWLHCSFCL